MPRSNGKRELNSWESYFTSVVTELFDFLITEYGFVRCELRRISYEIYIEFTRPPVAVEIGVGSGLPFIFVKQLVGREWRGYNLVPLVPGPLEVYFADLPTGPYADNPGTQEHRDAIRKWLTVDANLLRTYGQRFLSGDPSQLGETKRGEKSGKSKEKSGKSKGTAKSKRKSKGR